MTPSLRSGYLAAGSAAAVVSLAAVVGGLPSSMAVICAVSCEDTTPPVCDVAPGWACLELRSDKQFDQVVLLTQKWTDGTTFEWFCDTVPAGGVQPYADRYVGMGTTVTTVVGSAASFSCSDLPSLRAGGAQGPTLVNSTASGFVPVQV